ncbi:uncharacterized protein LOC143883733 isoform X2 [Tasmannia lanceolata]|uniref:uncharacterized protein LOC143883733 isoform X2 n=1 Tax=Tasmannia lanceolata TaxID=3420 RepID=UPI0040635E7F
MAKYVLSRCCPFRFQESLKMFRLHDAHKNLINDTPFRDLLLHKNLEDVELRKRILTTLVRKWDPKRKAFRLGSIVVPFLVSDVAKILGLTVRGERVQLDWDSITMVDGWRFGLPTATFEEVVNVIHAEMDSNEEESIKSTVKRMILLFCSTILFAQRDHKACSCLFPYIDLGTIGDVAWAYLVHEFLLMSLNSHAALGGKGHILGCSIILQVWLFEHTTIWVPDYPDAYPCLFKWIGEDTKKTEHRKLIDRVGDGMVKPTEVVLMVQTMAREEALLLAQVEDDVVGVVEDSVGDSIGAIVPTVGDAIGPIVACKGRERRRRGMKVREGLVKEVQESASHSSLLERIVKLEREVRELKSQFKGTDSLKKKSVQLSGEEEKVVKDKKKDARTKKKQTNEDEQIDKTGHIEKKDRDVGIRSDKGRWEGGLVKDPKTMDIVEFGYDVGKDVVVDPIDQIYINSQITEDDREVAANIVAILLDTPEMKSKQWSIENNVKQRRRRTRPSRAMRSPYYIGQRKFKDALAKVTGPAATKVDALAALQPCDKVIQSDGYYMCKEDLLLLSDRRGWLASPQLIITDRCENPEACSRFVKRLENISLKELRKVLIPINIDLVHWVLLLLDMGQCTFALYDSLVARTDPRRVQPLGERH